MKNEKYTLQDRFARVVYFFPFQLLLLQLKSNWFLLIFWALPVLIITESFGITYGIPATLLYPEYLGRSDFLAHFILGFSLGGFIMAYHITSYISNGYNFSFIATLSRPFYKYSLNNSLLPLFFIVLWCLKVYNFQTTRELVTTEDTIINIVGILAGIFTFISITMIYFFGTNKNLNHTEKEEEAVKNLLHKEKNWTTEFKRSRGWKIKTYIGSYFRIKLANPGQHYPDELLRSIIQQNHINASFFEIGLIVSVILFGIFGDKELFFIPAGASIFLVLTLILMVYSAFRSWLKLWTPLVLVSLVLMINYLSKNEFFNYLNQAYGLSYTGKVVPYNTENLNRFVKNHRNYQNDIFYHEQILKNWKNKIAPKSSKPKLILINCSGGGLRSAAWTYRVLWQLDSISDGNFFNQVHAISGASGGIMSAAYYRELVRRRNNGIPTVPALAGFDNLTKDLLNPIIYTFVARDIFYRPNNFKFEDQIYIRDRGLTFEEQINKNLDSAFAQPISFFTSLEKNSEIPLLVFAPTITNDGRRLIIASSPSSFLCNNFRTPYLHYSTQPESIEYTRFFESQNAKNTQLSSVIRMSATFPYVLPNVSLPTQPIIEVMDAGVRDNYGLINNLNYLFHLKQWISENTSGIVLLQIRDTPKEINISQSPVLSLFKSIFNPLGGFTRNWIKIQTYNQDQMVQYLAESIENELFIYDIELPTTEGDEIPISWHLTLKEKNKIKQAVHQPEVQQKLKEILKHLQ